MTMYNMLYGMNDAAPFLMVLIDVQEVGRFRDAFLNADGTEVHVLTRNGGGNRECVNDQCWDGAADCKNQYCRSHFQERVSDTDCGDPGCYACIITHRLPKHPLYLWDRDDDFDCTYATIAFKVPEKYLDLTKSMATGKDPESLKSKLDAVLSEIRTMPREKFISDPRFASIVAILKELDKASE